MVELDCEDRGSAAGEELGRWWWSLDAGEWGSVVGEDLGDELGRRGLVRGDGGALARSSGGAGLPGDGGGARARRRRRSSGTTLGGDGGGGWAVREVKEGENGERGT